MTAVAPRRAALGLATLVAIIAVSYVTLSGNSGAAHHLRRTHGTAAVRRLARASTLLQGTPTASGLRAFRDPGAGFSVSYPASWHRLSTSDSQVPLLVSNPGGSRALLIRVIRLGLSVHTITPRQLPTLLPLTNRLVHAGSHVQLLVPAAQVTVSGLPGYAYAYTSSGSTRGSRIAHLQYFLFSGGTMISLVFQVTDASHLKAAAPTFARIAKTFRTIATTS